MARSSHNIGSASTLSGVLALLAVVSSAFGGFQYGVNQELRTQIASTSSRTIAVEDINKSSDLGMNLQASIVKSTEPRTGDITINEDFSTEAPAGWTLSPFAWTEKETYLCNDPSVCAAIPIACYQQVSNISVDVLSNQVALRDGTKQLVRVLNVGRHSIDTVSTQPAASIIFSAIGKDASSEIDNVSYTYSNIPDRQLPLGCVVPDADNDGCAANKDIDDMDGAIGCEAQSVATLLGDTSSAVSTIVATHVPQIVTTEKEQSLWDIASGLSGDLTAAIGDKCASHADCKDPEAPICDPKASECVACTGDTSHDDICKEYHSPLDVCNEVSGSCEALEGYCDNEKDCGPDFPLCNDNTCSSCSGEKLKGDEICNELHAPLTECNEVSGSCEEPIEACVTHKDCLTEDYPQCDEKSGECVKCAGELGAEICGKLYDPLVQCNENFGLCTDPSACDQIVTIGYKNSIKEIEVDGVIINLSGYPYAVDCSVPEITGRVDKDLTDAGIPSAIISCNESNGIELLIHAAGVIKISMTKSQIVTEGCNASECTVDTDCDGADVCLGAMMCVGCGDFVVQTTGKGAFSVDRIDTVGETAIPLPNYPYGISTDSDFDILITDLEALGYTASGYINDSGTFTLVIGSQTEVLESIYITPKGEKTVNDGFKAAPCVCEGNADCPLLGDADTDIICNTDKGICEPCSSDDHCKELDKSAPFCNTKEDPAVCVECTGDKECSGDQTCSDAGQCLGECNDYAATWVKSNNSIIRITILVDGVTEVLPLPNYPYESTGAYGSLKDDLAALGYDVLIAGSTMVVEGSDTALSELYITDKDGEKVGYPFVATPGTCGCTLNSQCTDAGLPICNLATNTCYGCPGDMIFDASTNSCIDKPVAGGGVRTFPGITSAITTSTATCGWTKLENWSLYEDTVGTYIMREGGLAAKVFKIEEGQGYAYLNGCKMEYKVARNTHPLFRGFFDRTGNRNMMSLSPARDGDHYASTKASGEVTVLKDRIHNVRSLLRDLQKEQLAGSRVTAVPRSTKVTGETAMLGSAVKQTIVRKAKPNPKMSQTQKARMPFEDQVKNDSNLQLLLQQRAAKQKAHDKNLENINYWEDKWEKERKEKAERLGEEYVEPKPTFTYKEALQ